LVPLHFCLTEPERLRNPEKRRSGMIASKGRAIAFGILSAAPLRADGPECAAGAKVIELFAQAEGLNLFALENANCPRRSWPHAARLLDEPAC
jgi:hypothetical protein